MIKIHKCFSLLLLSAGADRTLLQRALMAPVLFARDEQDSRVIQNK